MLKILSVDDSKSVHSFLADCFSETQHELDFASNGEEALQKQESNEYDVIVLDWEMPGMTGPEVLKALKERGCPAPVIMLTSRNKLEEIGQVLSAGAAEYIMKPFTREIVFEKLKTVLGEEI